MAGVALSGRHVYSSSISGLAAPMPTTHTAPEVEVVPNPDFAFPMHPPAHDLGTARSDAKNRRPVSMNIPSHRPRTEPTHARGSSMLPSFSFNANDASGLDESAEPVESLQRSPSKVGHKRQTSELGGGKGISDAINSSPTRTAALGIPGRGHGRGHSRSRVTLTSSDWSSVMTTAETQPRLSSSLPNTPLEQPAGAEHRSENPFGPPLEDLAARPPSRPRVEFSENVEYIPRPLSTISSETASSMSTVRGHSVNNSISSVLSLSTPSPPSARARAISLEPTLEDETKPLPRSSLEISRRVDSEKQRLKAGTSDDSLRRPVTQPALEAPKLTFNVAEDTPRKHSTTHKTRQSLSHALGFDRRKSEPAMGLLAFGSSRLSALSLQEQPLEAPQTTQAPDFATDRRSSTRRLKEWAMSKISKRPHDASRTQSCYLNPSPRPTAVDASPVSEPVEAETDLDAVFSLDSEDVASAPSSQPAMPMTQSTSFKRFDSSFDSEDSGAVLDLDAALGPFRTPPLGSQRPRRELHSSRGTRDFVGPGGHYLPTPAHRRTESAPMLTSFDQPRTSTPPPVMADVFEEDEEEDDVDPTPRPASTLSLQDEELGVGVSIVDSDSTQDEGPGLEPSGWELERPTAMYGALTSGLSAPMLHHRASSVIEDTIFEEASPVEPAIVEAHEEPRAHSLTKSSDSSETPTILAAQTSMLALPDSQQALTPPESYQSSPFSSPDLTRRQGSFDTSRVGTSTSSITDNRTTSSCTTGEPTQDVRVSVDDVPSLTSSRSTMMSTQQANSSRRDVSGLRTPSLASGTADGPVRSATSDRRRKSIQSLSQLMGSSFSSRSVGMEASRPRTATATDSSMAKMPKKEHRLKKLMFWKSKHRQASAPATAQ